MLHQRAVYGAVHERSACFECDLVESRTCDGALYAEVSSLARSRILTSRNRAWSWIVSVVSGQPSKHRYCVGLGHQPDKHRKDSRGADGAGNEPPGAAEPTESV